jgi:hypothetical protein
MLSVTRTTLFRVVATSFYKLERNVTGRGACLNDLGGGNLYDR